MDLRAIVISLRKFRKWHRSLGLGLALFLLVSAVTGMLLGLKKEVDWIQPPTQRGMAVELNQWLPLAKLDSIAILALHSAHTEELGNTVDRIDVRPSKGIVKVLFKKRDWEVQLEGGTGKVLSIARRHSDLIERIHDGSIVSNTFKLFSMQGLGLGLLILMISGIWLYFGPKKVRRSRRNS